MWKVNLEYSIGAGYDFSLGALIAAHRRLDCDILNWAMQPRIYHFANNECVSISGQMLVNGHIDDLSLSTSFYLFILANGHRDQLTRGFKSIRCTCQDSHLHNIIWIQRAQRLECHTLKHIISIPEVASEIDQVHVQLILRLIDEEWRVFFFQICTFVWNVDEHVSMYWWNGHIVSKWYALWPAERVIFVYLQSKDVKPPLIHLHKFVINSHCLLLR